MNDYSSEFTEGRQLFEGKTPSVIKSHPDFPNQQILHDPTGKNWEKEGGSIGYIDGAYFLDNFRLSDIVTNKEKTIDEIISSLKPLQEEDSKFYNLDAVQGVTDVSLQGLVPNNVNADLGTQARIRTMIEKGILDEHTFVILTHGHFAAGLAELTRATTPDNKYMFDTTAYLPRGDWPVDSYQAQIVAQAQLQLWSEEIKKGKNEHGERGREWAGGIAVGLYGHRNRRRMSSDPQAKVDPTALFGTIDEYKQFLQDHGLNKVVVITEENAPDPNKVNSLPLERLKDGLFGGENFDLYDYFKELTGKETQVFVVSGDTRTPQWPRMKQLAAEEKELQL